MASYKDYYQTLGLSKTATQAEIKSAFRKLAAKYHPDKNPGDTKAEDKFKEINEAYTVLYDPEKRKFYDQYGTADGRPPFAQGGGFPGGAGGFSQVRPEDVAGFSDFFQSLFGGGFPNSGFSGDPFASARQAQIPRRVEASLDIDLLQAYHGVNMPITVAGKSIEVTLPKGAKDGSKLRLKGQAPNGADLYLILKLEAHPVFTLAKDNIRVRIDVSDYQAVLGGVVKVPTLDGDVEMNLPPGTQTGQVLRLRGQGWPKKDGGRGDELAEVRVVTPKEPSKEQLELYKKLEALQQDVASVLE